MKGFNESHMEQEKVTNKELLKLFAYPDYRDVKVYSRQYYLDVLLPILKAEDRNFTYIFMDFNKLGELNSKYGIDEGHRVVYESINTLDDTLDIEKYIARIGGDEYAIIIPDVDREQAIALMGEYDEKLKRLQDDIHNASVTYSIAESSEGTIEELYEKTEKDVNEIKKQRKRNSYLDDYNKYCAKLEIPQNTNDEERKKWQRLNFLVLETILNHIKDIRPSKDFLFSEDDFWFDLQTMYEIFLNQKAYSIKLTQIEPPTHLELSYDEAKQIQRYLEGEGNDIDEAMLDELLNSWIRCNRGNIFTEAYMNNFLSEKLAETGKKYQVGLICGLNIKPSNTTFGHDYTDYCIGKTAEVVKEQLSRFKEFNDTPFVCNKDTVHLLDFYACNYMFLIPEDNKLTDEEFQALLEYINSYYKDELYTTYKVVGIMQDGIDEDFLFSIGNNDIPGRSQFRKLFDYMQDKSVQVKDNGKMDTYQSLFNKCSWRSQLQKCIEYFQTNIPNSETTEMKKIFISNYMRMLKAVQLDVNARNKKDKEQEELII